MQWNHANPLSVSPFIKRTIRASFLFHIWVRPYLARAQSNLSFYIWQWIIEVRGSLELFLEILAQENGIYLAMSLVGWEKLGEVVRVACGNKKKFWLEPLKSVFCILFGSEVWFHRSLNCWLISLLLLLRSLISFILPVAWLGKKERPNSQMEETPPRLDLRWIFI